MPRGSTHGAYHFAQCHGGCVGSPPAWLLRSCHTSSWIDSQLEQLAEELRTKTYQFQPVRRVYVKMWLVAPVEEKDTRGHIHRTTRNKDEGRGSPQGAPISPLLPGAYR